MSKCIYLKILSFLESLLTIQHYEVYKENMKVAIPGETQFFYPDILITKEAETDQNRYVQYQPELIAEVLSGTTRAKDTIDKFMQYRKIPTLEYYLLVEPEKLLVICYSPYSAASCKSWLTFFTFTLTKRNRPN